MFLNFVDFRNILAIIILDIKLAKSEGCYEHIY